MIETFKQFFLSVWTWFVENKDGITAFFMSGQALSFAGAIVLLIKNLRGVKANTASTDKLDATLINTNEMSESVKTMNDDLVFLKNENENLRSELRATESKLEESNRDTVNKLNTIIDVQTIVYSTIRDDEVRLTVNKLLNNARYSEKNLKESFENKIDELKADYEKGLNDVNTKLNESVNAIKTELNAAKTAEAQMGKRVKNVRY